MNIFGYLLDWIYPPRCIFCRDLIPLYEKRGVCGSCEPDLPWVVGCTCEKCGKPVSIETTKNMCSDCTKREYAYTRGWAVLLYAGRVREMVYRFKYSGHLQYAPVLGEIMVTYIKQKTDTKIFDILIPVPMHKTKQKQRGYNQAALLAAAISDRLHIPTDEDILIRTKQTKAQSGLSIIERQNNIKDAFQVQRPTMIEHKIVLLIDDIYTTGSTIEGCSKVILAAGARAVYFLALSIGESDHRT